MVPSDTSPPQFIGVEPATMVPVIVVPDTVPVKVLPIVQFTVTPSPEIVIVSVNVNVTALPDSVPATVPPSVTRTSFKTMLVGVSVPEMDDPFCVSVM
jgi:hypothetical protein